MRARDASSCRSARDWQTAVARSRSSLDSEAAGRDRSASASPRTRSTRGARRGSSWSATSVRPCTTAVRPTAGADGSSATRDNQHVQVVPSREATHGSRDFGGSPLSLNSHGIQEDLHVRKAAGDHVKHVSDNGPRRRRHQPHFARKKRERPFPIQIKETLAVEFFL